MLQLGYHHNYDDADPNDNDDVNDDVNVDIITLTSSLENWSPTFMRRSFTLKGR